MDITRERKRKRMSKILAINLTLIINMTLYLMTS